MTTVEMNLSMPEGYVLCPFPKNFGKGSMSGKITLSFKCEPGQPFTGTIEDVLSNLTLSEDMINWTTSYSAVKSCSKFILGIKDDRFYREPNPNPRQCTCYVTIKPTDIRLYGYSGKPSRK